jgi:hypothetical protein
MHFYLKFAIIANLLDPLLWAHGQVLELDVKHLFTPSSPTTTHPIPSPLTAPKKNKNKNKKRNANPSM